MSVTNETSEFRSGWLFFKRGLNRQKSAIWALVFKEFKLKLGKSRIGLFWVLVQPIFSMLMISGIWYMTGRVQVHGTNVTLYIGSGFIIFLTVRQGLGYIANAIDANQALLNYPQVKPIDTILARFVEGMWLHAWASVLLILGLWWILGVKPTFPDLPLALECVFGAMLLALGFALPLAVLGTLNDGIMKFVNIISQPLMIFSGVVFSIHDLPASFQGVLALNPIVHLVEGFRAGAFGNPLFNEFDLGYPLRFGVISLGFGYALYFRYRFKLLQK
ncbi:ABC transporter permease [uncultured Cohaesibacter sp.]|uniref:ABC transporter permease n=1 Tax=uncultured Cohaesibacter sp. TaxID=1002546 RepID=UPI0029C8FD7E|nr:ABC transporter permease [uncultured Cohaesibacter sp.]